MAAAAEILAILALKRSSASEVTSVPNKLCFAALLLLTTLGLAQDSGRAQTEVRFVEVEPGINLEVVDWGGRGRPVVLLAGLGETAHVYYQFASKLTDAYHVFGITRRGFGASSVPNSGYTASRLADDVVRVLDVMKIDEGVLVGHSVAGEELSAVGARYADRIAGLIYLDAAWDRTYSAPKEEQDRAAKMGIAGQPKAVPGRFDPAHAVRAGVQKPDYDQIRVPALAFYPASRSWQELLPGAPAITDPEKRALAEQVVADVARVRKRMAEAFRSGVAASRVIELPGAGHYLFQTNESDVLREMRLFIEKLPAPRN